MKVVRLNRIKKEKNMFKKEKKIEKPNYDPKTEWICPTCGTVNKLSQDYCTKCLETRKKKRDRK
jgi:rubrerythrin